MILSSFGHEFDILHFLVIDVLMCEFSHIEQVELNEFSKMALKPQTAVGKGVRSEVLSLCMTPLPGRYLRSLMKHHELIKLYCYETKFTIHKQAVKLARVWGGEQTKKHLGMNSSHLFGLGLHKEICSPGSVFIGSCAFPECLLVPE